MKKEFEMSMVGELNFFLGLQVKQIESGILITQSKDAEKPCAKVQPRKS